MTRMPLLIWYVSSLDFLRSLACLLSIHAMEATVLWPLRGMGHVAVGLLGLAGAGSAMLWLSFHPRGGYLWFIPQLTVLLLGARSGLVAIAMGRYADGTVIDPAHIFADQIGWILLPIFYGAAAAIEVRRDGLRGAV